MCFPLGAPVSPTMNIEHEPISLCCLFYYLVSIFPFVFPLSCLLLIRPCRKCNVMHRLHRLSNSRSIENYKIDCGVHLFENERRKDKNIDFRNRIKCNEQWHSCTIPFRDFLHLDDSGGSDGGDANKLTMVNGDTWMHILHVLRIVRYVF